MYSVYRLALIAFCFFSFECIHAQTIGVFDSLPEQAAIATYHSNLSEEAHLFSGSEFISYTGSASAENQFFKFNYLQESTIVFDGLEYKQVPLMYDIVTDDLIVGQYREQGLLNYLKIDKNKVTEFELSNHAFLRIHGDAVLESGFYEKLYKGNLLVLAKREKTYKKEVVTVTFPADNYYYILKDGSYHPVKSKVSVLKLLKDHKRELTQFLKANNIVFHENRESAIAKLAEHYDILTQAK